MAESRSTALPTEVPRAQATVAAPRADAPEEPVRYIERPLLKPGTVEHRDYQVNLAVTAMTRPSLVVLPTGLGKTVIALLVAADRLHAKPQQRVVILAPTKPLVEQHATFFRNHLDLADPDATIVAFSGSVAPDERAARWKQARVIAATPQVIENDLVAGRIDLREVSLVVFDEAHRATGDYPYLWIAGRYLRDNPKGLQLGLTASPGSSAEKILEVCTGLGLADMELRTEGDEDVRPYIHELSIEWEKVPLPESLKRVGDALRGAIVARVAALKRLDILRNTSGVPSRKELLAVAGELQSRIRDAENPDRRLFDALSLQAQAMKISHALELVETQGAPALLAYWQKLENEASGKSTSKATDVIVNDPRLIEAVQAARAEPGHDPKLERVVDAVRAELTVADDPRIIVFANYRETCERITDRLGRLPGCRPVRFVGQTSRDGDKGLTQREQQQLVQGFRDGTHNVLVATSVAEEGLDIPQTDLVIFHEPVPSEIRAIQRRGRTARRRRGRAIVLMYAGTRDEAYHWSSRRREQNMRRELRGLRRAVVQGLRQGPRTPAIDEFGKIHRAPAPGGDAVDAMPSAPQQDKPAATSDTAPRPTSQGVAPLKPPTTPSEEAAPMLREHADVRTPILAFFDKPRGQDGPVRILVDHRESRSGVVKALERQGVEIRPAQLSVADYAVSDRVAVERKTVEDFLDSLLDGRLFAQARQMTAYLRPILILEGDGLTTARNIPRSSIFGALASLGADFGIAVLPTHDARETADLLVSIAKREQTETRRDAPLRLDKVTMNDHDRRRYLLEGLPNVSATLARRLIDHFGSVEAVMTADVAALMEVDGIGRKTATEIRRLVAPAERPQPDDA